MRDDMYKVICETYRQKFRSKGATKHQGLRSKESMRFPHRLDPFQFGENLSPLYRWLRKQKGRPWDDVWSEICRTIPKSTLGDHVKLHVTRYVEQHVEIHDGVPFAKQQYGSGRASLSKGDLYVHPETGVLVANKKDRVWSHVHAAKRAEPFKNFGTEDEPLFAKQVDGIWKVANFVVDDVLSAWGMRERKTEDHVYHKGAWRNVRSLRHMTKGEMKRCGVSNR